MVAHWTSAEAVAIMAIMAIMATIAMMAMMAVMAIMALLTDLLQRRQVNLPIPTWKHTAIFWEKVTAINNNEDNDNENNVHEDNDNKDNHNEETAGEPARPHYQVLGHLLGRDYCYH